MLYLFWRVTRALLTLTLRTERTVLGAADIGYDALSAWRTEATLRTADGFKPWWLRSREDKRRHLALQARVEALLAEANTREAWVCQSDQAKPAVLPDGSGWLVHVVQTHGDLFFGPYATQEQAVEAMNNDLDIEAVCAEDAEDAWVVPASAWPSVDVQRPSAYRAALSLVTND